MTRRRAFLTHLSVSACIGATVTLLILFLWYPDYYFRASGAEILMATLIFVDVVLGPALTLILFKPGKPGLAFDMTMIFILQVGALIYGLNVIVGSRPVFLVAAIDRYVVISANQIDLDELPDNPESPYNHLSWSGPELVGLKLPEDIEERNRLTFLDISGRPSEAMPKLYVPHDEIASDLIARAKPFSALLDRPQPDADIARDWLRKSDQHSKNLIWVPMQARKQELVMVIHRDSRRPIAALPLDPWR